MKERHLLHKETLAHEHGDIVFPRYKRADECGWSSSRRFYQPVKGIRDTYYAEINHILNDFSDRFHDDEYRKSYRGSFLENVRKIQGLPLLPYPKNKYGNEPKSEWFEWLNHKKVIQVIKQWEGDPLDSLYYLARHGYIEKAVKKREKKTEKYRG
jgi:hypothetical protein